MENKIVKLPLNQEFGKDADAEQKETLILHP